MPKRNIDQELLERRTESDADADAFLKCLADCMETGRVPAVIGEAMAQVFRDTARTMATDPGKAGADLVRALGIVRRKRRKTAADKINDLDLVDIRHADTDGEFATKTGLDRTTVNKALAPWGGREGFQAEIEQDVDMAREYERGLCRVTEALDRLSPRPCVTGQDINQAFPRGIPARITQADIDLLISVADARRALEAAQKLTSKKH